MICATVSTTLPEGNTSVCSGRNETPCAARPLRFGTVRLTLVASAAGLREVILGASKPSTSYCDVAISSEVRRILGVAEGQLGEYFTGARRVFDLPIDLHGTREFQRRVLEACMSIGYGQTASYGQLAAWVGSPQAARAVGRVMATNPWPIIIPCHRVVGANGGLTGYGGGLELKAALLAAEQGLVSWHEAVG